MVSFRVLDRVSEWFATLSSHSVSVATLGLPECSRRKRSAAPSLGHSVIRPGCASSFSSSVLSKRLWNFIQILCVTRVLNSALERKAPPELYRQLRPGGSPLARWLLPFHLNLPQRRINPLDRGIVTRKVPVVPWGLADHVHVLDIHPKGVEVDGRVGRVGRVERLVLRGDGLIHEGVGDRQA